MSEATQYKDLFQEAGFGSDIQDYSKQIIVSSFI